MADSIEQKLLEKAQEGNLTAVKYWLQHNTSRYSKHSAKEEQGSQKLTISDVLDMLERS